jgi:superfamily II DNA/RNA helicase
LEDVIVSGFAELQLNEAILRAVDESGYTQPTAIQAQAIPAVLAGRDVVGIAQTGTGKTASFVLPMLHVLANGRARARMPRSLILSPTRELATQTSANFEVYGKHLNLTMALLIGGVGMGEQEKALEKGVDVLIATPGRLLDWFDRGRILLGGVQILVIDEADRMLDMGFIPDVERILTLLTKREQTLLFSATMPPAVRRLAEKFLNDPAEITVARPASTVDAIEATLVSVDGEDKRRALLRLIREQDVRKAIIFCNRKRDVSSLNRFLQQRGLNARDIHGDLEQVHRQATLDAFKADEVDFLVATDVAARGLDISDMPNVINFDVPFNPEDYVHRIGRTGRAGKKGRAFTLATRDEGRLVAAVERVIGKPVTRQALSAEAEPVESEEPRRALSRRSAESRERLRERRPTARRERSSAAPTAEPETAPPPPSPAPSRVPARERDEAPAGPVVAFGNHVPRFMLRPVPISARVKAEVEAEAAA